MKPLTKWEQFARSKGITKKRKERAVWDEERQEWRARWGRDGANKKEEGAWLSEVKANAGTCFSTFFYIKELANLVFFCDHFVFSIRTF